MLLRQAAFIHDGAFRAGRLQDNGSRWVRISCLAWPPVPWLGDETYPHIDSLCQAGIKVIDASSDRCWKVGLKHERSSPANAVMTHSRRSSQHMSAHFTAARSKEASNGEKRRWKEKKPICLGRISIESMTKCVFFTAARWDFPTASQSFHLKPAQSTNQP